MGALALSQSDRKKRARRKKLRMRQKLPAAEALPRAVDGAAAEHAILRVLRGSCACMIGQHAQQSADRELAEVDRSATAARDDAVLLVGVDDDEVVDRRAALVADHAIT